MKKQSQRNSHQVNEDVGQGAVAAGDEGLVHFVGDGVEGGEDGGGPEAQTGAAGEEGEQGVGGHVPPFLHEPIPHAVRG